MTAISAETVTYRQPAPNRDDATPTWWVRIERGRLALGDLVVGPYPSRDAAEHARDYSALVDDLVSDDRFGCLVTDEGPEPGEEHVPSGTTADLPRTARLSTAA